MTHVEVHSLTSCHNIVGGIIGCQQRLAHLTSSCVCVCGHYEIRPPIYKKFIEKSKCIRTATMKSDPLYTKSLLRKVSVYVLTVG